ncbi:Probable metal-dependent transcriptional regulator [Flavobacterium indicum GPTSA100-9 = DSM 17447]|uniref:Transcriptional regulator MntR n=1 Tax=Flavobacterium indicum (strain DSM 17447 / CIP 109464 / GPTSA100-9) TaxID=1094466 RepID=H8XRS2_FLAIG|nr:metal-dependent transcriptional regulator [Flavobacterium indicum]CCG54506.1 Probable metal-dependent transcriptional regulator [Flavobacterium indicum GPTSA100-9 = DSM 17447]
MTISEENYLKAIYHLIQLMPKGVNTNTIAASLDTKASSVTDMLKKLSEKELVTYQKYQGVTLTESGKLSAKMIVRKHRLWEVFLVDKLGFAWDEVHEVAEELEHIQSEKLINQLDQFLNFPSFDPHGDPIPNAKGEIVNVDKQLLSEIAIGKEVSCVGVKDSSPEFLKYLDKQQIALGTILKVIEKEEFDGTLKIQIGTKTKVLSDKIANNLFVK